ncbi:MAG: NADH-quinone oxidoreductase subunit NuoB [Candidatus Rokubacteria bacterium]|nr:NADH-quinone oxidoreductase subunit NuoB [Candidatus Rokubacteria bacterium]
MGVGSFFTSKLDAAIGWARKYSIFQYPFVTACFVVGTISHKMAPVLKRVYDQMTEPKWVVAFGVCTCTGGFYTNYATVQGIDTIIPVDVYIPGCPPRPESVIDGLMKLQDKIAAQAQRY